jgi:hypothetical protein
MSKRKARGHGGKRRRGAGPRGRGRGNRHTPKPVTEKEEPMEVSLETNPQGYFTGSVTMEQHYNGQNENRGRYAATMAVLQENRVEIAQSKCTV